MIEELKKIRHYLHSRPEVSRDEKETARFIIEELTKTSPDELLTNIGGYGIIAFYSGAAKGKSIAIRADFDALPIPEETDLPYSSKNEGVSHKCGHDGHTTIALGVARYLAANKEQLAGEVAIIFQPAEETGTGAAAMLADAKMKHLHFDYVFALHNLPGFAKNSLVIREGAFASCSTGVIIRLIGKTSHAAHPEQGNNPVRAMTALIDTLNNLPQMCIPFQQAALVTVIHARLGEVAFGTTPGSAVVMATLRAHDDRDLQTMRAKLESIAAGLAAAYSLQLELEWVESFPSIINDSESVNYIRRAAEELRLPVIEREHPLSWTEDFAHFTRKYKGAYFGLGAGENYPQIHTNDYDFPDELIETGVNFFVSLIKQINSKG